MKTKNEVWNIIEEELDRAESRIMDRIELESPIPPEDGDKTHLKREEYEEASVRVLFQSLVREKSKYAWKCNVCGTKNVEKIEEEDMDELFEEDEPVKMSCIGCGKENELYYEGLNGRDLSFV